MNFPRLHPDTIEEVKEKIDIYDIVSDYVVLKKRGQNHVGLCPFHQEKTPSFTVNQSKQMYYCFGCGEGGNGIKFLMEIGQQSFSQVVLELANRYQVPLKTLEPEKRQEVQKELSLKEQLYEIVAVTSNFFEHALRETLGENALNYLIEKRKLQPETIQKFNLGYAPSGWETLYRYLVEQKRYPIALVEEAGLIKPRKKGNGYYDTFRDRLMIPIKDIQGRVIAFGGRSLTDDEPKYLNSPETPLFNKGKTLFALDQAKSSIRSFDKVIVVEGYFDAIALHSAGITNTVASLGTAFSESQLKQLLRYSDSKEVIFNFDADQAGIKATERAIKEIESLIYSGQVNLKILNIPDGKDADEFINSHDNGSEQYQELIEKAPLWLNWKIEQILMEKNLKQADNFEQVAQGMVKLLNQLSDSNQRSYYISYCAEILAQGDARLLTLYLKNLQTQLSKPLTKLSRKNTTKTFIKLENTAENNLLKEAETILLKIYIHYPEHRQEIFDKLEDKNLIFSLSEHRIIWQKLLDIDDEYDQKLVSKLEADIANLSEVSEKVNKLLNFREIEQYEDSSRLSLIIDAALISLEKVNLEKYCNYCEKKYKTINPEEDPVNYQYYLNEYISSRQKILQLQPLRSFSQLDIYS
ncbi:MULTISPECIES: DNA primase [Crocosphaera]|uniref:DNA primase n=3 Tax=Crocosphaera watsonii TaxID=263511 RepID=T2JRH3_CROWT|nr:MULTISPECIES: DNA primase [Crocosphaera]EHJ10857.1 DNA primase [Crocosphaera watsonii WH 0003]MCH2245538.1 DNA primase [Crocosphaera sp.]NQZ62250.1 DNA primase [Crocosphaera sp.]CCQ56763.1 DNA primase [Crocosphaera watsonii WH 0005]CCQ67810.1 DNA primase [Crocosphaera watsonii WH 0402]